MRLNRRLVVTIAVFLLPFCGCTDSSRVSTVDGAKNVVRKYIRENLLSPGQEIEELEWFPLLTNTDNLEMSKEPSEEAQKAGKAYGVQPKTITRTCAPGEALSIRLRFRQKGEKPTGKDPLFDFIDYSMDNGPADIELSFPKNDPKFSFAMNGERWKTNGGEKGWKPVEVK